MSEVTFSMAYNDDTDEVVVLANGDVQLASGADLFKSWVDHYNTKHAPEPAPEPEPVPEPVVEPVAPVAEPTPPVVDKPEEV